jgi:NADP-dependent 3-hydroxy acid dehydrogenase YdfG
MRSPNCPPYAEVWRTYLRRSRSVGTDMQPATPEEQRKKEQSGEMLKAEDIAACIHYCLVQPARCDVIGVQIRPHGQPI